MPKLILLLRAVMLRQLGNLWNLLLVYEYFGVTQVSSKFDGEKKNKVVDSFLVSSISYKYACDETCYEGNA